MHGTGGTSGLARCILCDEAARPHVFSQLMLLP